MSERKPIYMETTSIPVDKTAGEITALLVQNGARQVTLDYDEGRRITGIHFTLVIHGGSHTFRLPVRTDKVREIFKTRRIKTQGYKASNYEAADAEQAERVAWRQLLRWVQAQLAMSDIGMVSTHEVFTPYLIDNSGQTLFEVIEARRFKALPAADSEKGGIQ